MQLKKPEPLEINEYELNDEIELETEINNNQISLNDSAKIAKKPIKTSITCQRELKSLLVLSSHGNKSQKTKLKDCLDLFEILHEKNVYSKIEESKFDFPIEQINLFIFGNRYSTLKMLEMEETELKRIQSDKWWYLEIWKGNLANIFSIFKNENTLNDCIFNLYQISQFSNPNTLSFLIEYINQLAVVNTTSSNNTDQIHKAVMYSLASFNIHKAIDIYCSKNMFQYALCIAHVRLSHEDPVLNETLIKYAAYSTFTGDYETSLMCYIRLNDIENAYKVLIRRNIKNDTETEKVIEKLLEKFSQQMNNK